MKAHNEKAAASANRDGPGQLTTWVDSTARRRRFKLKVVRACRSGRISFTAAVRALRTWGVERE